MAAGNPVQETTQAPWSGSTGTLDRLILRLWSRKLLICAFALAGGIAGGLLSTLMTRIYEVEVVLSPSHTERTNANLSGLTSQFGDLAAMFGVALPGADNNSSLNLAYLKSRQFTANFITENDLMPVLFAPQWDAQNRRWRSPPGKQPTMDDAVRFFSRSVLNVRDDRKGGLVTVVVRWRDRQLAARWANQIVADINSTARQRAIAEAQNSLKYLNSEIGKTSIVGLREAISRLMENNINSIMLANVRPDYAFQIVDPGTVPDQKHYVSPVPLLDAAVGGLLGALVGGVLVVLLARRQAIKDDRSGHSIDAEADVPAARRGR